VADAPTADERRLAVSPERRRPRRATRDVRQSVPEGIVRWLKCTLGSRSSQRGKYQFRSPMSVRFAVGREVVRQWARAVVA
jgi:hypothetical protein